MKKAKRVGRSLLSQLLALVMVLSLLPVEAWAAETSGDCGPVGNEDAVSWIYDEDSGTLTISGSGDMADYASDGGGTGYSLNREKTTAPWKDLVVNVIIIEAGVTSIGDYAFHGMSRNLPSGQEMAISIADTVERIGYGGLNNCALTELTLPASLKTLGIRALSMNHFSKIVVPEGVEKIPTSAFYACGLMKEITLPSALRIIEREAFEQTGLVDVVIPEGVSEIEPQAFYLSFDIKIMDIPASVTSIGYGMASDSKLETLILRGSPVILNESGESPFSIDADTKIYYPYDTNWPATLRPFHGDVGPTYIPCGTPSIVTSDFLNLDDETSVITIVSDIPFNPDTATDTALYQPGGILDASLYTVESVELQDEKTVKLTVKAVAYVSPGTSLSVYVSQRAFVAQQFPRKQPGQNEYDLYPEVYMPCEVGVKYPTEEVPPPEVPEDPEHEPEPTPPNSGGGTVSSRPTTSSRNDRDDDRKTTPKEPEELLPPEAAPPLPEAPGPSGIQDIVKPAPGHVDWVERIQPPDYALQLYDVLVLGAKGTGSGLSGFADCLIKDSNFTVRPDAPPGTAEPCIVEEIEEVTFSLSDLYADGSGRIDSVTFENDDFLFIGVNDSDRTVNYGALQLGDVVKTANFNGIFVTHIPRGGDFDARKKEVCSYISTVFQAFDRDHPEVFWLSGKCRIRIMSIVNRGSGAQEAYFFLSLADLDGFTMRAPAWTAPGSVDDGISRRDSAVNRILSMVTGETAAEKVRQLNKILTEQNEYNTTADLSTISNEPHECLAALEGRAGKNGPVCDGYSRAFKVLCDQLDIPCVLENGYARTSAKSAGTFHMWNSVQVDGNWYGADITWDDPLVRGVSGAKSGYENERYLLVGSSTEIRGMTFSRSHPASNQAAQGGVAFDNGPPLSTVAFTAMTYQSGLSQLPFDDVSDEDWFAEAVEFVYNRGLMDGVTDMAFRPGEALTREEAWMLLASLDGESFATMAGARSWAMDRGITDGKNPEQAASRQQLVTFLYRYCQWRDYGDSGGGNLDGFTDSGSVAAYARDAFAWAVNAGIVSGTGSGALQPAGAASRAQTAVMLHRLCGSIAGSHIMGYATQFNNTA